ncbi:RING-H2 finger protein ATL2-like [Bidens hawaiensis]|uniref:RING-H2 finger protein ATL2-like n=1 Tax=Bidens hawaiensis TaxID=980011 RepID=UPI00404A12C8
METSNYKSKKKECNTVSISSLNPALASQQSSTKLSNMVLLWIIWIFIVIMFLILLYFVSRHCRPYARQESNDHVNEQRGMDRTFLQTIRVVRFDPERFQDGLQCAVCLCEVKEGEKTRVLPECEHGFHMECVDMWFYSHSTCPVCRNPMVDQLEEDEGDNVHHKGSTSELDA